MNQTENRIVAVLRTSLLSSAVTMLLLLSAGCVTQPQSADSARSDGKRNTDSQAPVLAIVNGVALTEGDLAAHAQRRGFKKLPPHNSQDPRRLLALNDLIDFEVLSQEASRKGLDQKPAVRDVIESHVRMTLVKEASDAHFEAEPVTDETLRARYEQEADRHEYKLRHILTNNQDDAHKVIAALQAGESFEELARKYSSDPATKRKGGDLGWYRLEQMANTLGDAIAQLRPGTITELPVQSGLGWHVIRLDEVRQIEPPDFETVKSQLRIEARRDRYKTYLQELRERAEVEFM